MSCEGARAGMSLDGDVVAIKMWQRALRSSACTQPPPPPESTRAPPLSTRDSTPLEADGRWCRPHSEGMGRVRSVAMAACLHAHPKCISPKDRSYGDGVTPAKMDTLVCKNPAPVRISPLSLLLVTGCRLHRATTPLASN